MGKKKKKKMSKEDFNRGLSNPFYGPGAEAREMLKRYGVAGTRSVKPDNRGSEPTGREHRELDQVKDDLAAAMMNDYDTRRSIEAAALMGNKDAKKYAKKGIKGAKGMSGAWDLMKDLKKEYVGGGGMRGAENEAGLTFAVVKADREKQTQGYKDEFASKTDLSSLKDDLMKQAKEQATGQKVEMVESDRFKEAKERLNDGTYNTTNSMYGGEDPSSMFARENVAAPKSNDQEDAAGSYLEQYKRDVVKGGKVKEARTLNLNNAFNTVVSSDI